MSYCSKCGAQLSDDVRFCASCGQPVSPAQENSVQPNQQTEQQNQQTEQQNQQSAKNAPNGFATLNNTVDKTAEIDPADIQQNKFLAVLSYLGILVLVPIFGASNSKFARFHANQGLIMLIIDAGYGIIQAIIMAILSAIFPLEYSWIYGYSHGVVYTLFSVILSLVWIPIAVLIILGIVNAATGKAKELPIVGKIKLLK